MVARGGGLARGRQRAGRHRRAADPAGDRRAHMGVVEVDRRRFHRCLVRLHGGAGLLVGGLGVVVVLAADRVLLHQVGVACSLQPGGDQVGLGVRQGALRLVQRRLIGGRVDLVEHLAGANVGALDEKPRLDDAVHLRPHVGRQGRRGAARQLGGAGHRLRLHRHHADVGRPRGRRCRLLRAGGRQHGEPHHQAAAREPATPRS